MEIILKWFIYILIIVVINLEYNHGRISADAQAISSVIAMTGVYIDLAVTAAIKNARKGK